MQKMSQNVWATIMPFGPVTLIFHWPKKFALSSKFDMWVDNDVPTLKNFYRSPFSKWMPQYRTNSTLSDFNEISYLGRL
jgi:hypothetical protein